MSDDKISKVFSEIQERATNISKYSDRLRGNLVELDGFLDGLATGVIVYDKTPFFLNKDDYGNEMIYHWFFDNEGLWIKQEGMYDETVEEMDKISLKDASRRMLVAAVKRVIPFMELIVESMTEHEKTIKQAAATSKKMLKCIKSCITE